MGQFTQNTCFAIQSGDESMPHRLIQPFDVAVMSDGSCLGFVNNFVVVGLNMGVAHG